MVFCTMVLSVKLQSVNGDEVVEWSMNYHEEIFSFCINCIIIFKIEKLTFSIKNWSEPQQPFKFDLVILWVINIITVICKYSSLQLYHV